MAEPDRQKYYSTLPCLHYEEEQNNRNQLEQIVGQEKPNRSQQLGQHQQNDVYHCPATQTQQGFKLSSNVNY